MIRLFLLEENSGSGVVHDLNDRVECVLLNEFIPNAPTENKTVTDQCQVQLRGVAGRAKIQTLNRLFQTAREHPHSGLGVYLCFAISQTEPVYQSRLVDGKIDIDKGYSQGYKTGKLNMTIAFEHDPYWEGPEEIIPLSNPNGTNVMTGLKVFSCNDLIGTQPNKRCNYVDIPAGAINGEIPAPIKLIIKNTTNSSGNNHDCINFVWIGENFTNPGTAKWHFEGEAASSGEGSNVSWSLASGGAYRSGSIPAGIYSSAVYTTLGTWPLSAADLSAYAGQRVKLILATSVNASASSFDLLFQVAVGEFESDWVAPNRNYSLGLIELFDFRLPSYLEGVQDLKDQVLSLRARNTRDDQVTAWGIDFFALFPADGWIWAAGVGDSLITNHNLVLDGSRHLNYVADPTSKGKVGLHLAVGDSLSLHPGKAHRFYFLFHNNYSFEFWPNMNAVVSASYRPRRRSI